ncbi:MAG: GNAT family N-acetyltransferase [Chloroflexi bacterium]|nr:GNAT family N-acetyltransferase [Chloroflexota bacterium]
MVWRAAGDTLKDRTRAARKQSMRHRIEAGEPVGILGYLDGEPVAWCSIAPRDTYQRLGGPAAGDGETVWSLICFYVLRRLRGQGIARQLLAAAVDRAAKCGATIVEAYPVAPDSPSYRSMGTTTMFRAAGFKEIGRAGTRRHIMHLTLGRSR